MRRALVVPLAGPSYSSLDAGLELGVGRAPRPARPARRGRRARVSSPRQIASSSRRPSASRRTRWASRWSDQKSGWEVRSSSAVSSSCLGRKVKDAPRSRGRGPPGLGSARGPWTTGCRVCDGGGQPRARRSWSSSGRSSMIFRAVLLRATTGFTHGQYPLCEAFTAVAVAVEPGGVAARAAIALAGDQVGERLDRRGRPQPPPVTASRNPSPSAAPGHAVDAWPGPI